MERTWEISDINGKNKRTVTLAQYKAELAAMRKEMSPVVAAFQSGDIKAMAAAQALLRQ